MNVWGFLHVLVTAKKNVMTISKTKIAIAASKKLEGTLDELVHIICPQIFLWNN
jgi:hypothetical protein